MNPKGLHLLVTSGYLKKFSLAGKSFPARRIGAMKSWTLELLEEVPGAPWKKGDVLAVWAPQTLAHGFAKLSDWAEEKEEVEQIRDSLKEHFGVKSKAIMLGSNR